MSPFSDMAKDEVVIAKQDGRRLGPYKSILSANSCRIFDKMLDVEHGDKVVRPLPNGKEELYLVLRADYMAGFDSTSDTYKLTLQKEQQIHTPPSSVVNNVSISHSTGFQVGDNNIQNIQNAFRTLEKAIDAQAASSESKADAKSKLQAVLQHPLVVAVLGGVAGGIAG